MNGLEFNFLDIFESTTRREPTENKPQRFNMDMEEESIYMQAFNKAESIINNVSLISIDDCQNDSIGLMSNNDNDQDTDANDMLNYIVIRNHKHKKKLHQLRIKYRYLPLLFVLLITSIPRSLNVEKDKEEIVNLRNDVLKLYDCQLPEEHLLVKLENNTNTTCPSNVTELMILTCEVILLTNRLSAIFKCKFEL